MSTPEQTILFLDDVPSQRRSLELDLRSLFGETYNIVPLELHPEVDQFARDLESPGVVGVFIDQKLNESGEVNSYNGVILCEYLRSLFPSMPIYLVTGKEIDDSLRSSKAGAAESVVHKKDLRADTNESLCLKQRFLRHAARYLEALDASQRRFRELLEQSATKGLNADEQEELDELQAQRLIPSEAAEQKEASSVRSDIDELERLIAEIEELKNEEE